MKHKTREILLEAISLARGAKMVVDGYNVGLAFENVAEKIEAALGEEPEYRVEDQEEQAKLRRMLCGKDMATVWEMLEAAEVLRRKASLYDNKFYRIDEKNYRTDETKYLTMEDLGNNTVYSPKELFRQMVSQETDGGENDGEK